MSVSPSCLCSFLCNPILHFKFPKYFIYLLNEDYDDNARGVAECVNSSRDGKPTSIIPVVYKRNRCFNWFVLSENRVIIPVLLNKI